MCAAPYGFRGGKWIFLPVLSFTICLKTEIGTPHLRLCCSFRKPFDMRQFLYIFSNKYIICTLLPRIRDILREVYHRTTSLLVPQSLAIPWFITDIFNIDSDSATNPPKSATSIPRPSPNPLAPQRLPHSSSRPKGHGTPLIASKSCNFLRCFREADLPAFPRKTRRNHPP